MKRARPLDYFALGVIFSWMVILSAASFVGKARLHVFIERAGDRAGWVVPLLVAWLIIGAVVWFWWGGKRNDDEIN